MRLLLAEDEKALSKALVTILERNNYSVDAVDDGQAALDYLEADNYDGVILDIMMPKVDGITVLKTIRSNGNRIPVLMLTAKAEVDDKVLGLDSGANDYLTKPFHTQELLARIRAMTRTQTAQTDSRLQMGNVTLDCATFELSTPAGSFRLANKEFQVLELLMRNPHSLIASERLLEKSGAMTVKRKSTWVGSISPTCAKNCPPCMPTFKSKPPEMLAIHWRNCHDPKTAYQADYRLHGFFAGCAAGHYERRQYRLLPSGDAGRRQHTCPAGRKQRFFPENQSRTAPR